MARSTPSAAYRRYFETMQSAVGCITHGRFVGRLPNQPQLDKTYTLPLNDGDPVSLKSEPRITFSAGQQFRILEDIDAESGLFRVMTVQYWYQLARPNGTKLLTFHWTPETTETAQRRYPHLHVESGLIDPNGPFIPDTFSKLHIPTERVSIEAVVRFAIEELGVQPIRHDWDDVLAEGHAAFMRQRRQGQSPRAFESRP